MKQILSQQIQIIDGSITNDRVQGKENVEYRAGAAVRVISLRFDPDIAAMHFDDPLGNGESQTGSLGSESNIAGAVLFDVSTS